MKVVPLRWFGSRGLLRWFLWVAVLVVIVLPGRSTGAAGEFRIRKVRNVDKSLFVYHDPVAPPAGATSRMRLNRGGCQVDPQAALVPLRQTEDRYAVLIVLDRGGTRTNGMGRYSDAVVGAVKAFLDEETKAKRGDVYTIVDASGSGTTQRSLPPTDDMNAIRAFLEAAPEPSGAGADVYGNAASGMNLLEQNTKPLRAAVIISDGRDPHASGTSGPDALIKRAHERDVAVFSIIVDRSNESSSAEYKVKLAEGRGELKRVSVETTGGELAVLKADAGLQAGILGGLHQFSKTLSSVMRTACAMCGEAGSPGELEVQIVIDAGGTVAFQSGKGSNDKVHIVNVAGLPACPCGGDAECAVGQKCTKGACVGGAVATTPETSSLPWWPFAAGGGLLVVGGIAVVVVRSKGEKRRAEEAEAARLGEAERRRQEDASRDQERQQLLQRQSSLEAKMRADEARRAEEQQRKEQEAREAAERERVEREAAELALREQQKIVVFVLRAIQPPDGVPEKFDLRVGEHLVGRDDGLPIKMPIGPVSGQHALLRVTADGRAFVRDLNSSNGTHVNGNRLAPEHDKEVRPGDEIKFSRHVTTRLEAAVPSAGYRRAETKLEER